MFHKCRSTIVQLVTRYLNLEPRHAGLVNLIFTAGGLLIAIMGFFAIRAAFGDSPRNGLTLQYSRLIAYGPLFFVIVFLDIPWLAACVTRGLEGGCRDENVDDSEMSNDKE